MSNPVKPWQLYLSNLAMWRSDTRAMFVTKSYYGGFFKHFLFLQVWDRGTNTLSGGDPRMTISGRVSRDRRDNFGARLILAVANFFFHKDGPGDADPNEWPHGEGSDADRNLPNPAQEYAIVGTVLAYAAVVALFAYLGPIAAMYIGRP